MDRYGSRGGGETINSGMVERQRIDRLGVRKKTVNSRVIATGNILAILCCREKGKRTKSKWKHLCVRTDGTYRLGQRGQCAMQCLCSDCALSLERVRPDDCQYRACSSWQRARMPPVPGPGQRPIKRSMPGCSPNAMCVPAFDYWLCC